jgi:hypothetical protein
MQMDRDDSTAARLGRYWKCGKWFGKICCCVVTVDWWYWKFLEWWEPAGSLTEKTTTGENSFQRLKTN